MSAAFPSGVIPGHYLLTYHNAAPSTGSPITGNPNFKGINWQTDMRTMELVKNDYSNGITLIQAWINWINVNQPGNKLFVTIEWNTFSAADRRIPEYIRNPNHADYDQAYDPSGIGTGGVCINTVGGECLKIWNAAVRERMKACYLAIYNAFKNNPTFSGLYSSESAQALVAGHDRTSATFRNGWKDFMDIKSQMPDKMLFAAFNFLTGESPANFRDVLEYGAALGVALGCPDIRMGVDVAGADTSNNVAVKVGREVSQRFGDASCAVGPKHEQALNSKPTYSAMMAEFRNTYGGDFAFWRPIQASSDPNQQNFNPHGLAAVAADVAANPYPWAWGESQGGGAVSSDIVAQQGRVALNTSTGNQVLPHSLGVTPFFGMLRATGAVAEATYAGTLRHAIGFTDGTRQVSLAWLSSNGSTIGTQFGASRGATDTVFVLTNSGATTVDGEASHVSWDGDGWTINISDAPATAVLANYLAMAGGDGSAYVNKLALTTQNTEAVLAHGLGDDGPNLVIVLGGAGAIDDTADNNYRFSIGLVAFDGDTITQRCYIAGETNSTNPSAIGAYISNLHAGGNCAGDGVPTSLYEVTTIDGTNIGITPRNGDANVEVAVACLKLDNASVNLFDMTLPTATGAQSHSMGVLGEIVLAVFSMMTDYNTPSANSQAGSFAVSNILSANQYSQNLTVQDNRTTTSVTKGRTDDQALFMGDHSGSSGGTNSHQADFTEFSGNNLELNHTAVHTSGGLGFGVAIELTAANTDPPSTPGQPTMSNIGQNSADATWTASTHALGIQKYNLYLDTVDGSTLFVPQTPPTTNSYSFAQLASGVQHYLRVSAVGNNGVESALSTVRTFTTLTPVDNVDPSFAGIQTLVYDPVTQKITGGWSAATDNVAASVDIVYDVYISDTTGGQNFSTPDLSTLPGVLGFELESPEPGHYYAVVRARDPSDNQESNTVELHVEVAAEVLAYEVPANTYQLDNASGSIYRNTTVQLSWTVNGSSGFRAGGTVYDLDDVTTDPNGWLPTISLPGPESGELDIRYLDEYGVLVGRWIRGLTPSVVT